MIKPYWLVHRGNVLLPVQLFDDERKAQINCSDNTGDGTELAWHITQLELASDAVPQWRWNPSDGCWCGEAWESTHGGFKTCVGYFSPPGHDHNDNCVTRRYACSGGHRVNLSVRRKCPHPECYWAGKRECGCHRGRKCSEWPKVSKEAHG